MNRKNKNQFRMQTAELGKSLRNNKTLYLFLLLPIVYFIIFKYVPMFGNIIAFRKYIPGQSYFGVSWEGFRYFEMFLKDEAFWNVFKNTVVLSGLSLLICFPIPILFSLLLNEIMQKKVKKVVQSLTIVPRFLSVVVVVAMMNALLSPSTGIVNTIIEKLGGEAIYFMNEPFWFRIIYIISELWQFLGWNSIIYMAVLSSADQEQYEAAMVDGAGKIKQAIHITLPMMLPTIAINLIIALGNILNIGFEKVLLMYTPTTYETADIIQTFVYRVGLMNANYSYGTAVGLFQGVISLSLLWAANRITNKRWGCGLW
ncbi:ABC transporter permease subunit [Faecalicatena contorta]|uniref:ABC transporter permease subunit n=1 Tax=Faecalicatena contorta TaxID=39482 RepID=UPI00047151BD